MSPDEQLTIDLYKPSEVQREAHACHTGDFTEILYGGTAGCGKTVWLWWDPIETQVFSEHERYIQQLRMGNKGWRSSGWHIHLRREYPMLKETIACMKDIIPKVDPGAHWNGDDNVWTFTCGYRYEFGHLQREDDYRIYDSRNFTSISFDEVIQTLHIQYMFLYGRLRSGDPVLGKNLRLTSASNPDAPPEGIWVKERFVDPAPMGRKLIVEQTKMFDGSVEERSRVFIPANLKDNPNEQSRRTYEVTLRQLPHHVMLARLMGDWNIIQGAFFEWEWKPEHHVVEPFPIPDHWGRFRVIDYGYKRACPIYHVAEDPQGNLIFYRETTFNHALKDEKYRKDAQLIALSIKNIEMQHGEWDERRNMSMLTGPCDPEMNVDDGRGVSIRGIMENEGVYWESSSKNIPAAVAEFIRRLRDIPKKKTERPGIVFFSTCKEAIRTIPMVPTDKNDHELPEHGGKHHWLDAILMACMYKGAHALKNKPKSPTNHPDFDAEDEIGKERSRRRYSIGGFRHFAR